MFPGLDLYCTDPSQHIITAGYDLDYLDRDLSDLSDLSDLDRDLSDVWNAHEWSTLQLMLYISDGEHDVNSRISLARLFDRR